MNFILKFLARFIGIILIITIINKMLVFFGIEVSSYIIYMFWFLAIGLFYLVLPKNYELFT